MADSCEMCVRYRTGPRAGELFMRCVGCATRHLARRRREEARRG